MSAQQKLGEELRWALRHESSRNGHRTPETPELASWPEPLDAAAYHGVTGQVVRAIEPHSESDPAAVMVQFLTHVGNACDRLPRFNVESTDHYLNLFVAVVGATSSGRKGTSYKQSRRPLELSGAELGPAAASGMSTGEGLIQAVRDPTYRKAKRGEEANSDGMVVDDGGVDDKRLLVVETELGSVVGRMGRQDNTLSAVLRQAWDGDTLRVLTRKNPLQSTGAHVSVVGHVTIEELRKLLSTVDIFSGFANRFLWCCAKRSRRLPEGGGNIDWGDSIGRLKAALARATSGQVGVIGFDLEARERWHQEYEQLTSDDGGAVGAVTNRAEAQVRRLACVYAVLDRSDVVQLAHLEAALEIWRYCEDSARYLFGSGSGDPVADQILDGLRRAGGQGLTRTEISRLLGNHQTGTRIEQALMVLVVGGLTDMEKEGTTERWRAR